MIHDKIQTTCPFAIEGVVWRSVTFHHKAARELLYKADDYALQIVLPRQLQNAVAKRQAEYLAGRLCAADALHSLGLQEHVGLNGRLPVWPPDTAGSISHTGHYAVAAVSIQHDALGVDCEGIMAQTQADALHHLFLSTAERKKQPAYLNLPQFATLVFSAKEAFYKGMFTRISRGLEFSDVLLHAIEPGMLQLAFEGRSYPVCWRMQGQMCLTLFAIPRDAAMQG